MPTIDQLDMLWSSGFRDDDRIGRGGFESPSGRQWWEPERNRPSVISRDNCKSIGYLLFDFEAMTERFIDTRMLEDFTKPDDQDWIDFNSTNRINP